MKSIITVSVFCFLFVVSLAQPALAAPATPAAKQDASDGYAMFKNLCAYKVYFHVDFVPSSAGTSDFALWEDETYRLRFGPNKGVACYTRSADGIRKCPSGSTLLTAGQIFEACGDDNLGDD